MSDVDFSVPLSEEEFELLFDFFNADFHGEEVMNLDMFDGFIVGVLLTPKTILPSEWLPVVWDTSEGNGNGPQFASEEEAERITGMLFRYMNTVRAQLQDPDEHSYVPLFFMTMFDDHEDEEIAARSWALGFAMAIEIAGQAWDPIVADTEALKLTLPIYALSGIFDDLEEMTPEELQEVADILPETVYAISDFWDHFEDNVECLGDE